MNTQVACVSGGTSGIGRALTKELLRKGYSVVAIGKGEVHARELSAEAATLPGELVIRTGDLRSADFVTNVVAEIEKRFGKLEFLANCAGTISGSGIETESFDEWQSVMSTNLDGMFLLIKATVPLLRKGNNPAIVNVSSVCSLRPCTSLSYSVSKAGTDMFTKVLAKDLARYKIRVNSVNPGVVRTNLQFSAGLFNDQTSYDAWVEQMMASHPLGRVGEPGDIVSAIIFLASDEASWITGAILSVDGGRSVA